MMDGRGVIGLPIKLAVSFLIIGLMLPALLGMVGDLESEQDAEELYGAGTELRSAMVRAYYSGTGNQGSLELSVPSGGALCIGGDGKDRFSIRMLEGGEEIGRIHLDCPVFPVHGPEQCLEGDVFLTLTCVTEGSGPDRTVSVKVTPYD